jgi:exodeoxyribonuclease VII large subunit
MGELGSAARLFMQAQGTKLKHLEQATRLLDPVNILKRGYSITYRKNRVLKNTAEVAKGDLITTRLFNGVITSKVEEQDGQK